MAAKKFFMIVPRATIDKDLVLSVQGKYLKVWARDQCSRNSRLFFEEPRTSTIRNKSNDFCLDVDNNGFIVLSPYMPDSVNQQWRIKGDIIQNGDDESRVLDVSGYWGKIPGGKVEATTALHNGSTQRWNFETI